MISFAKKVFTCFALSSLCLLSLVRAEGGILDYSEQNWPLTCQTGVRQTPIDIPANYTFNITDFISITSSNYSLINSAGLGIFDNHKFYIQNVTNAGPLMVKKADITYQYDLIDIHFHIVSEHTVKGLPSDVEMHLVHRKNIAYLNATGITNDPDVQNSLLVVGIRYRADVSQDNGDFTNFNFATLSPITNLNLNSFVNPNKSFFHYLGGLTTPSCDEIVNWVLMEAVESISPAQLQSVKQFISPLYPNGNARSIKPLNQRTIYYKNATITSPITNLQNDQSFLLINKIILVISILFILLI